MPIDYDEFAHTYDKHRTADTLHLGPILAQARRSNAERALELGAGTGMNTALLHDEYPCRITAVDCSEGMLLKARAAAVPALLTRADATELPFASGAFDFVYGTYMLHYIQDLDAMCAESWRVLERGCLAALTVPERWIRNHPMAAYFPSFPAIDLKRFQPVSEVERAFRAAGFLDVTHRVCTGPPQVIDTGYVKRVADKFVSTFALLPPGEFEAGLARLKQDVQAVGHLPEPFRRQTATIWGYK